MLAAIVVDSVTLLPFELSFEMKSQPSFVVERQGIKAPRCCCCLDVRTGTVLIGLFNLVSHIYLRVFAPGKEWITEGPRAFFRHRVRHCQLSR